MTALTGDVYLAEYGVPDGGHQPLNFPVEVGATIYRGSIALIRSSTGYLKNANTPSGTDVCVGMIDTGGPGYPNFTPGIQNASSAAGWTNVTADVRTGSFYCAGDVTVVQSTVGQSVYVVNETTVSASSSGGTLPKAGTLIFIDPAPPPTAIGSFVVKFNVVGAP